MRRFELIDAEKADYEITCMAQLLEVSRSGYYAWLARRKAPPGPSAVRRAQLIEKVLVAHTASGGVNGAPRILAGLRALGEVVSRKTVAKLMREQGIAGISPATWHPVTTVAGESAHTIPDLVDRDVDRGRLDVVWTSDIVYLPTACNPAIEAATSGGDAAVIGSQDSFKIRDQGSQQVSGGGGAAGVAGRGRDVFTDGQDIDVARSQDPLNVREESDVQISGSGVVASLRGIGSDARDCRAIR